MFFCRNDRSLLTRARARVRSARAAVFAEFCFIAPILMLLVSGMIEIAGYFDARVMANHTAWTIGRQATVHMEELTTSNATGVVSTWHSQFQQRGNSWAGTLADRLGSIIPACKQLRDHGKITAVMMMATCGIGYFGGSPGKDTSDFITKLLVDPIKEMFAKIKEKLSEKAGKIVPEIIPGADWINKMLQKIVDWLFKTIVDPIVDKITGAIAGELQKILKFLDDLASGPGAARRRFRQVYGAARRAVVAKDTVYTITHLGMQDFMKMPGGWEIRETYNIESGSVSKSLDFPATFNRDTTWKDYRVGGYYGWPPPSWHMSLMRVDVNWPYEMGWLFPVVSGFRSPGKPVVASGSSLVFPQPEVDNDFLKSEGARAYPYDEKGDELAKALKAIAKEARQYMQAMVFAMQYRLREEKMEHRTHDPDKFIYLAHDDHFYTPLVYCWFDKDEIDKNTPGTGKPWGSPGSTEGGTIRDDSMGYYKSWYAVCDKDIWCTDKCAKRPLEGEQHRNRNWRDRRTWFYWHNVGDGGRYRARYFHIDKCNFKDPNDKARQMIPSWQQSLDRMSQFRGNLAIYLREMIEQLEGRGDPAAGGPAHIIDFTDMKGVDLTNVKAVTAYFRKKWKTMREKCEEAYNAMDALLAKQHDHSEVVLERNKDNAKASADYVYNSFPALKDAECKLCGLLGSRTAMKDKDLDFDEWMKRKPGPVDPGKSRDPYKPGSDPESWLQQDQWKWSKEGGWE